MERLDQYGQWIFNLAYVNLLWLLFTAAGLIFLSIFPATIAMITCIRRWREMPDRGVKFDEFLKIFKKEFKGANRLGLFILPIIVLATVNTNLVVTYNSEIPLVLMMMYVISLMFLFVLFIHLFTVYVYFEKRPLQAIVTSISFGFSKPFKTMITFMFLTLVLMLIFSTAGAAMFFGVSLAGYMLVRRNGRHYEQVASEQFSFRQKEAVSV